MTFEDDFPSLIEHTGKKITLFCRDDINKSCLDKVRVQQAIENNFKDYIKDAKDEQEKEDYQALYEDIMKDLGIENATFSKGDETISSHIAEK
jgi:hypothetical protein